MIVRCILLLSILALSASCTNPSEDCGSRENSLWSMAFQSSSTMLPPQPPAKLRLEVENFGSCADIEDALLPKLELLAESFGAYGYSEFGSAEVCSANFSNNSSPSLDSQPETSPNGGVTNLQESGVDEGDMVKVSESLIFVAKPGHVEMLKRADLNLSGKIETSNLKRTSLLYFSKTLVVMGLIDSGEETTTQVRFYDVSGTEIPKLKNDYLVRGEVLSTRLLGSRLIVVTNKELVPEVYGKSKEQLQATLRQSLSGIDCSSIYRPLTSETDTHLSTVHQFDLGEDNVVYSRNSILGSFTETYVSEESLYLTKKNIYISIAGPYTETLQNAPSLASNESGSRSLLVNAITKWNLLSSTPKLEAVGAFEGRTIGPWAYSELAGGEISVATTTYGLDSIQTNNLFILDNMESHQFSTIGSVRDFGRTEDIRSVRYIDSKAYVVTFKKTDPLFIINLLDPKGPQILSELKAPGFSRYIHPALGNKLVGVGYAADDQGDFAYFEGVQLSLFDIEDPLRPGIVSQIEIGDRGSFSDVLFNHQAFYHDPQSNLLGFPIVRVKALSPDPWGYKTQEFTGAQFYRVSESGFESLGQATHSAMIGSQCQFEDPASFWWNTPRTSLDINRIFQLDERLLAISRFGLTQHDPTQPSKVLKSIQFQASSLDCELD